MNTMAQDVRLALMSDRHDLNLFVLSDRALSFKPTQSACPHRVFVVSMPKSGTYLVSSILKQFGLVDIEVHISTSSFVDYRGQSIDEKLYKAREHVFNLPVEISTPLIRPGQFGVGHLPFDYRHKLLLNNFVRIFTIRELRDSLVSYMRFEHKRMARDPGRYADRRKWLDESEPQARMLGFLSAFGADVMQYFRQTMPWCSDPNSVVLQFEKMCGDYGIEDQLSTVELIQNKLEVDTSLRPERIIRSSLGQETLTYSGSRTGYEEFWSHDAEIFFVENGGDEMNAAMGYSRSSRKGARDLRF